MTVSQSVGSAQPAGPCGLLPALSLVLRDPLKTCRYWQRMYDSLVGLRRLVLLRTYMIVSTFMWSSLYLRDILSQHYRPLHTTMTHAVDMQTRCTLVQCRTPREVRYLDSKADSFPRSIVFPGCNSFLYPCETPHGRPLSENNNLLYMFSSAR